MSHLTIDIHTHILPENIPDFAKKFGYGEYIRLEHHKPCCARMMKGKEFFREIEENCWNPEIRMSECAEHGVHVQVLSTVPVMFNYHTKPKDGLDISKFLNDHIAEIVSLYPRRFSGLGTVPLQDIDFAIRELERCMKMGMSGVQIGTHVNGFNLNEKHFFPFWEAAEALGAAIFVHPWEMLGKERMSKYWMPWLVGMPAETSLAISTMIFGGVFENFPKLRVAFAHGGGSFGATIGRLEHGFNSRPDLVAVDNNVNPRHYLGKFYIDSLVHDADILDLSIKLFGADRIALGSDYPFPLGEHVPGKLIRESIKNEAIRERLLGGTALEWLGVEANKFI